MTFAAGANPNISCCQVLSVFLSVLLMFTNLAGENGIFFVVICVSLVITEAELFSYVH